MHISFAATLLILAVTAAHADPIAFNYNFTAPALNANQNIVGFGLTVDLFSSKVGKNQSPAVPTHATKQVPNPLSPGNFISVPVTTDGVDPKTLQNQQFFYTDKSFAVTKGVDTNTNDQLPGIPNGTTRRTDSASLA